MQRMSSGFSPLLTRSLLIASVALYLVGIITPSIVIVPRFGGYLQDILISPFLNDSPSRRQISVVSLLSTLLTTGNWAIFFVSCSVLVAFPLIHRIQIAFPPRQYLLLEPSVVRAWSLTELWLLAAALLSVKQPTQGAVVTLEGGSMWLLASCLVLIPIPSGKCSRMLIRLKYAIRLWRRGSHAHAVLGKSIPVVRHSRCQIAVFAAAVLLLIGLATPFVVIHRRLEGASFESLLSLFVRAEDEVLSIGGAIHSLWGHDLRLLAIVIFCASVLFPIAKLGGLFVIAFHSTRARALGLAALSRLGPASMLDALVVIVMIIAYADFPGGSTVETCAGFWAFTASVVLTSGISHWITSCDPRR
jgi:hypothetical protein